MKAIVVITDFAPCATPPGAREATKFYVVPHQGGRLVLFQLAQPNRSNAIEWMA
jgi:hypothetical protein